MYSSSNAVWTNSHRFHGPAPLHHTLINNVKRTGVTLQTMHPDHFDRGLIIDQTPSPGFEHRCGTVTELSSLLGSLGAEMLVRSLQERTFVVPRESKTLLQGHARQERPAPKITSEDRHLKWRSWGVDEVLRRHKIIGPLWNTLQIPGGKPRRVIWSGGFSRVSEAFDGHVNTPGSPFSSVTELVEGRIYVKTCDGYLLRPNKMKLDGEAEGSITDTFKKAFLKPGTELSEAFHDIHFS